MCSEHMQRQAKSQALADYVCGVVVVVSKLTMLASLMFPTASTYKSAKIIKGFPLSENKEKIILWHSNNVYILPTYCLRLEVTLIKTASLS